MKAIVSLTVCCISYCCFVSSVVAVDKEVNCKEGCNIELLQKIGASVKKPDTYFKFEGFDTQNKEATVHIDLKDSRLPTKYQGNEVQFKGKETVNFNELGFGGIAYIFTVISVGEEKVNISLKKTNDKMTDTSKQTQTPTSKPSLLSDQKLTKKLIAIVVIIILGLVPVSWLVYRGHDRWLEISGFIFVVLGLVVAVILH